MHTDHRFLKYNFSRHLEVIRVQRIVLIHIYQIENSRQCLPRFWNSSNDAKMDLLVPLVHICSKEFKVSGGDTFIGAFIPC